MATAARYPMPGAPAPDAPWHSYDHGAVHWVTMSTEHPYWPGTPQFDFLQADLRAAAARRDAAAAAGAGATAPRWIVFSGHRPFYSAWHGGRASCGGDVTHSCHLLRAVSSPFNGKIGVAAAQDPSDGPAAMAMQAALEPLWQQARLRHGVWGGVVDRPAILIHSPSVPPPFHPSFPPCVSTAWT